MASKKMKTVGVWAFLIGVVLALIVGIAAGIANIDNTMLGIVSAVMVVLGVIVGILNITEEEVNSFIIAAIGLTTGSIAIAGLGPLLPSVIGNMVESAFTIFSVFVAGAVFIPALKAVYRISKD
jgi:hypothetical protein